MGRVLAAAVVLALLVLVVVLLVRLGISLWRDWRTRRAPWEVEETTRSDGTYVVQLAKPGRVARVVAALPPGMENYDFQSALTIAQEDADAQCARANRREKRR
jgi:hypothetical protein